MIFIALVITIYIEFAHVPSEVVSDFIFFLSIFKIFLRTCQHWMSLWNVLEVLLVFINLAVLKILTWGIKRNLFIFLIAVKSCLQRARHRCSWILANYRWISKYWWHSNLVHIFNCYLIFLDTLLRLCWRLKTNSWADNRVVVFKIVFLSLVTYSLNFA